MKELNNFTEKENEYHIYIYEDITNELSNNILDIFNYINNTDKKDLIIHINSGGGSIIAGYSIYNLISGYEGKTISKIEGLCASMAFPIALSSDEVNMVDFGLIMLHNPLNGEKLDDKNLEILDKFKSSLVKIFTTRTQLNMDQISIMMSNETWLDSDEAKSIFKDELKIYKSKERNTDLVNNLKLVYNKIMDIDKKINNSMDNKEIKNEVDDKVDSKNEKHEEENTSNEKEEKETSNEDNTEETEDSSTEDTSTEDTSTEDNKDVDNQEAETMEEAKEVIKQMERKILELEEKLSEYEKKEEEEMEDKIENVLNSVKERLTDDEYSEWKNIGKEKFNFMKSNIEKMKNINKEFKDVENNIQDEDVKDELPDMRDMEKNDPDKLANIYENDFDLYSRMFKNTYGKELK